MSIKAKTFKIDGVVPVIPTPFEQNGTIAEEDFARLIHFACSIDVSALCLPAYASEFYKLSEDEREKLVAWAIRHSDGRKPIIAQVNYTSSQHSAAAAFKMQQLGADAIAVAVPRQFALSDRDVFRHLETILKKISIPLMVQDFYPGGVTIGPALIARLHAAYPHFRYVKLEEPLMAEKVVAIREATGDGVGVLEGWGGMYTVELAETGLAGLVPGLAVSDILARVWRLLHSDRTCEAFGVFQRVLPQILYSLQNMELFHHAEKRLLVARGVISSAAVREASIEVPTRASSYIDFLNERVLETLDSLSLPRNPADVAVNPSPVRLQIPALASGEPVALPRR